jgi:methylmalonyl-CoA mutase
MDEQEPLFSEFPPVSTEAWHDRIREDLSEDGLDELSWEPLEGLRLAPFYRADDLDDLAHTPADLNVEPGWQLRQDVTATSLDDAARQLHDALDGGAESIGLTSRLDDDGSLRDVPVQSSDDMRRLLDGAALGDAAWHLGGPAALPLLALIAGEAERRNLEPTALRGTLSFDPPAALARTGTADPGAAYDELAALLDSNEVPSKFRLLAVDLTPYHDAGASPDLELALACAAMSEHAARLTDAGCTAESVFVNLHVTASVGRGYFLEIAALRALRLLYRHVAGAFLNDDDPPPLCVQALTSRRDQTLYAPPTNMLRHTTEASAAVIGGADVVRVRPHDDAATGTATGFARRMARNTQHVLREEAHLGRTADPAGGAYYVEVLTDRLARRAWAQFQEIEERGGLLEALRSGYVQERIAEARERTAEAVEAGRAPFVGTTLHPNSDEKRLHDEQVDSGGASLRTTGASYDASAPLASRRRAFREDAALGDLLPPRPTERFVEPLPTGRWSRRWTEPFERLRLQTERHADERGGPPAVLLLLWGDRRMRTARADFARSFFGVAGFVVEEADPFETPDEAARAAAESDAEMVALCSSDEAYANGVSAMRRALPGEDAPLLVVAGPPQDDVGADAFIHRETPLLEALRSFQERLDVAA